MSVCIRNKKSDNIFINFVSFSGFRSRQEERQQYLDLQSLVIHLPEINRQKMVRPPEETAPSYYPVALVPGQFQEYYRSYNAAELLYVILLIFKKIKIK